MKTTLHLFAIAAMLMILSCKKPESFMNGEPGRYYSSPSDFFAEHAPPMQMYTVSGTSGGAFTTPQGTIVTVPSNAFTTTSGAPVTGSVTIEFKDIYKKSDMVFADRPTTTSWGSNLKSAGEFFIRATSGSNALKLAPGKSVEIFQPAFEAIDTAMTAFVIEDTTGFGGGGWGFSPNDSVMYTTTGYIYELTSFSSPESAGTWGNSDNPYFFASYTQTPLAIQCTNDPALYQPDVFLIFSGVNSAVHLYEYPYGSGSGNFTYSWAPIGLSCTVVAIGAKDGKLYSSFTPVTIATGSTVNFTLTETTSAAFISQLEALD